MNAQWTTRMKSNLPDKMVYAYDCDFITELKQKKERIYQKAKAILKNKNLLVNEDKTQNATIKTKKIETEEDCRNVIKLRLKHGDQEDIKRRKELSNIPLSNNETVYMEKEMENKAKDKATPL